MDIFFTRFFPIFFPTIFSHIFFTPSFSHFILRFSRVSGSFSHVSFFTRFRKFFTPYFKFFTRLWPFFTWLRKFFHAHHPPVGRCVQARATRGDAWLCGVPGRAHRRGRGWGGRAAGVRHRGPPVAALGSVWRLAARPLSGAGPAEPAGGGGSVAVNLVRRRR